MVTVVPPATDTNNSNGNGQPGAPDSSGRPAGDHEPENTDTPNTTPATAHNHALQILSMAERTAGDHVAAATIRAETIRLQAVETAERITRAAQEQARQITDDASRVLDDARRSADDIVRNAHQHHEKMSAEAERTTADARRTAAEMVGNTTRYVDNLRRKAREDYDAGVVRLQHERRQLKKQLETMRTFDTDYRQQLAAYIQGQLQHLWPGQPETVTPAAATTTSREAGPHGNKHEQKREH